MSAWVTARTSGGIEKIFIKSFRVRDEASSFIYEMASLTAVQYVVTCVK